MKRTKHSFQRLSSDSWQSFNTLLSDTSGGRFSTFASQQTLPRIGSHIRNSPQHLQHLCRLTWPTNFLHPQKVTERKRNRLSHNPALSEKLSSSRKSIVTLSFVNTVCASECVTGQTTSFLLSESFIFCCTRHHTPLTPTAGALCCQMFPTSSRRVTVSTPTHEKHELLLR